MTVQKKWLLGGGVLLGVAMIAVAVLWVFLSFGDAPDEVSLDDAVASLTESTTTTVPEASTTTTAPPADSTTTTTTVPEASTTTTAPPAESTTTTAEPAPETLDGVWTVDTSLDSFVGYRVDEELGGVGSNTAAGRTSTVSGSLELVGDTITAVSIEADVRDLTSDDSRRDGALGRRGLESDTFPTATFTLTEPIVLAEPPTEGTEITATARGDLTAHGVANPVEFEVEALLTDDVVIVVGSANILLSDFGIEGLTGFAVLSVADEGVVEFQLFFRR